jgi:hypothetical protein
VNTATAIVIPNDMPAPSLEIIPKNIVECHGQLLSIVGNLPAITSPDSASDAEKVLIELADMERKIGLEIEFRSKPAFQLHKAIIAVGKKALDPITEAKATLRGKIGAWNREQQRLRDEALAKAEAERQAAAAAAEKERQRLQAEADAKHAAEVAAAEAIRKKAQAEADAKAEAELVRLQAEKEQEARDLAEVLGTPVKVEQVVIKPITVVAPVVAAPVVVKVEIAAPVTVVPPMTKSSVVTKKVWKMEITEPEAIPAYSCGRELRKIDKVALRALLDEGIIMQGARLVEDTQDSMRAVRS